MFLNSLHAEIDHLFTESSLLIQDTYQHTGMQGIDVFVLTAFLIDFRTGVDKFICPRYLFIALWYTKDSYKTTSLFDQKAAFSEKQIATQTRTRQQFHMNREDLEIDISQIFVIDGQSTIR